MGNPYGIALNSAWTAWATECAVPETTAAALYLLSENRRADEVVAKLTPGEVKLVIDTVQRWPECFPARALTALKAARPAPAPEPSGRYDRTHPPRKSKTRRGVSRRAKRTQRSTHSAQAIALPSAYYLMVTKSSRMLSS
jgi:hypothetical protein